MKKTQAHPYSPREEIANSITHGIGVFLSIAGLATLVTLASLGGDPWRIVSFSIYGATLVVLYLCSTLYHSFKAPRVKAVFRVLDHISIFLLIAGSYTPFVLVELRGPWGWSIFGVVWGLALVGVILKVFHTGRYEAVSITIYILMGWLIVIALKPLLAAVPVGCFVWMLVGGLAYTLGVIFYAMERIPYGHAIWHLFVLIGSVTHFVAIAVYVLPVG
ncbi:hemolysin III family protein [bacterium]|nr:hemolysin III family protein [bacterium]